MTACDFCGVADSGELFYPTTGDAMCLGCHLAHHPDPKQCDCDHDDDF